MVKRNCDDKSSSLELEIGDGMSGNVTSPATLAWGVPPPPPASPLMPPLATPTPSPPPTVSHSITGDLPPGLPVAGTTRSGRVRIRDYAFE